MSTDRFRHNNGLYLFGALLALGVGCGDDPAPSGQCDTNPDCNGGLECIHGVCVTPSRIDSGTEPTGCSRDSDCRAPRICAPSGMCTAPDAGESDAGKPDAGRHDAGRHDAGRHDAGTPLPPNRRRRGAETQLRHTRMYCSTSDLWTGDRRMWRYPRLRCVPSRPHVREQPMRGAPVHPPIVYQPMRVDRRWMRRKSKLRWVRQRAGLREHPVCHALLHTHVVQESMRLDRRRMRRTDELLRVRRGRNAMRRHSLRTRLHSSIMHQPMRVDRRWMRRKSKLRWVRQRAGLREHPVRHPFLHG